MRKISINLSLSSLPIGLVLQTLVVWEPRVWEKEVGSFRQLVKVFICEAAPHTWLIQYVLHFGGFYGSYICALVPET